MVFVSGFLVALLGAVVSVSGDGVVRRHVHGQSVAMNSAGDIQDSRMIRVLEDSPTVVYIAHGPVAGDIMLQTSLKTLREVGKWQGNVAIITDKRQCFENSTLPLAKAVGLWPIVIETEQRKDVLHMKRDKTQLFGLLEKAGMRTDWVLYLDVDMMIGADIHNFLDLLRLKPYAEKPLLMYKQGQTPWEQEPKADEPYHSGIISMRKSNETEACLKQWAAETDSGKYHRDQEALGASPLCLQHITEIKPDSRMFWFPTAEGLKRHQRGVFMHFTRSGRMMDQDMNGEIARYFKFHGVDNPWKPPSC
eukprot:gb/GFBE01057060.1/.p1 GENE.gb/GFBE01057060.1/~~gb/GFBE01057060.1/.p1  ORF type:complete len:306 (+),score=52.67 gb/GFBE01057060.1/:1-918(+)